MRTYNNIITSGLTCIVLKLSVL